MSERLTKTDLIGQRLDKLEIALVLLLNCLRDRRELENGLTIIPALPSNTLDYIERMVLTKLGETEHG